MQIIEFDENYRDDMIFMVLETKNNLGKVPRLNKDLLDIKANYLDKGTKFFLALDDNNRVIGCLGYEELNPFSAKLHRFYVKTSMQNKGIGSALLETVEKTIFEKGYQEIQAHLGDFTSTTAKDFYSHRGYVEYQPSWMRKVL